MRKFAIMVAAVVTFATFASGVEVAAARSTTTVSAAPSCSDLLKKYARSSQSARKAADPKNFRSSLKQAAKVFNSLASNGPSQLKSSFKRLASAYAKVARSASDSELFQQLANIGAKLQKDFETISKYFATKCR